MDNLEEEDYDNLYFKKDKDLNGKLELMKYSFLELLLEYGKKYLTEGKLVEQPTEVKEATNELIMKNDTFLEWLDSYFVFEANRNVMLCEMTEKYMETTSTTFKYDDDVRKHILQEMRRIGTYQFDRLKKKGDLKRGAFKNIRFKTQNELIKSMGCVLNYDDEEEMLI